MEAKMEDKLTFLEIYHVGYQTWGFDTTSLSKLFTTLVLYVFDLQRPQWSDNGGQNGGQIENSWKYTMWGIKLEDLIPQVYLSYFQHWFYLCLTSNDLNGAIMEAKMEVKLKFLEIYHVGCQTWGFDTTSLSKLFTTLVLSVFDLQQPQWRDNGGQIKNSWKYTMWGIKLEDLIP